MNRMDTRGRGREGGNRGGGIAPQHGGTPRRSRVELRCQYPRQVRVDLAPQACDGMALRTIRGQDQPHHRVRPHARVRWMPPALRHQPERPRLLSGVRTRLAQERHVAGMQVRPLQTTAVIRRWRHGSLPLTGLPGRRPRAPWGHPAPGAASAWTREHANATALWTNAAPRTRLDVCRQERGPLLRHWRGRRRVFCGATGWGPSAAPVGDPGRPWAPGARPSGAPRRGRTLARSPGHGQPPGAGLNAPGARAAWPGTGGALSLEPWRGSTAGRLPPPPTRPASAPRHGDGPPTGAPPGGGGGPAGWGGHGAPARVGAAGHRARHGAAVSGPRAFRESAGGTCAGRAAPAKSGPRPPAEHHVFP
jgi:hypothetical protein